MVEQCEWCEHTAVYRIRVPAASEGRQPYERYSCETHRRKTERLAEFDHCKPLGELEAEITRQNEWRRDIVAAALKGRPT